MGSVASYFIRFEEYPVIFLKNENISS